jgi:8-oxo-dGTP pyrophosphatase MutT (NUDIX family)
MKHIHYDAAGGVVIQDSRVLVLLRPSRAEIRLPKGHIEEGETQQEAALREVTEESGYANLEVVDGLGHQVVEFDYKGNHVIRNEYYFLMHLTDPCRAAHAEEEVARTDHDQNKKSEQQFEPKWLDGEEALAQLTFEVEREWVRRALNHDMDRVR